MSAASIGSVTNSSAAGIGIMQANRTADGAGMVVVCIGAFRSERGVLQRCVALRLPLQNVRLQVVCSRCPSFRG